jgi:hypothetical protein
MTGQIHQNNNSIYSNEDYYPTSEFIELINNKGEKIRLPANATIEDLVKMGIKNISIEEQNKPMKDGYYYSF